MQKYPFSFLINTSQSAFSIYQRLFNELMQEKAVKMVQRNSISR